ncbi:helix-turn-helix domain-containing protein [Clostridium sp. AUH-JLR23]|uniref:helix-turn-helix domain-containing protein n=1 Tax=Clostridium sp. AUH-JLR23 TaxID=1505062 RepID=UPI0035653380
MTEIRMFTREEVAEILHVHVNMVSILREEGLLQAIKVGKNYIFPKSTIIEFERNYLGLDCSNREKAKDSKRVVDSRQNEDVN